MKYYIRVNSYINSKSLFASGIRYKQKHIDKLPEPYWGISHSEIQFMHVDDTEILTRMHLIDDIQGDWEDLEYPCKRNFKKYWLWFSSSEVDKWTRFKFINKNPFNWIYKEIEVTKEEYLKMLDFCIERDGRDYNYIWIAFASILRTFWFIKDTDYFCCQIVTEALQRIAILCGVSAIMTTPWLLHKELERYDGKL